jgi:hypothetical protein
MLGMGAKTCRLPRSQVSEHENGLGSSGVGKGAYPMEASGEIEVLAMVLALQ